MTKMLGKHASRPAGPRIEVPWREWPQRVEAMTLDREAIRMAAITMVLRSLHCKGNAIAAPISVSYLLGDKRGQVCVTEDVERSIANLSSCTRIGDTMQDDHPSRPLSHYVIQKSASTAAASAKDGANAAVAATEKAGYYLLSEWKFPEDVTDTTTESVALDKSLAMVGRGDIVPFTL